MPIGFWDGDPMCCHDSVQAPAANPASVATVASRASTPDHPPAPITPRNTSGRKPNTIRKNCTTSL